MTIDKLLGATLEELEALCQDEEKLKAWGAPYLKVTKPDPEEIKKRKEKAMNQMGQVVTKDSLATAQKYKNQQKDMAKKLAEQFGLKLNI